MHKLLVYRIFPLIGLSILLCFCKQPKDVAETSADIFNRYRTERGAKIIAIPPGLVSVFLDEDQPGNKEIKKILDSVDKLTFLVLQNNGDVKESENFSDLNKDFSNIMFQDLAMINNGKEIVRVKVSGDTEFVDEMIVLVSNYKALFCVSFIGNISMESVVNLTNPENLAAISNLNRISR